MSPEYATECNSISPSAQETRLADLGELAAPLTHDFNNFLNTVSLQLAVVQHSLQTNSPVQFLGNLQDSVRQMGEKIRVWQSLHGKSVSTPTPIDINLILSEFANGHEGVPDIPVNVEWRVSNEALLVDSVEQDLTRAILFALTYLRETFPTSTLSVSAHRHENRARLHLGMKPAETTFPGLPQPDIPFARKSHLDLRLAVCDMLARRWRGRMTTSLLDGRTTELMFELPLSSTVIP